MPDGWRTIKSLVHKIRLHGRREKGMAESFSRDKLGTHRRKMDGKFCVTPAGTSNELDVQHESDGHTHTHESISIVKYSIVLYSNVLVASTMRVCVVVFSSRLF